jgi:hypothetical protein
VTELEHFLRFLGSRYESARDDLDQVRVRAMELVVSAVMTELHRNPPVFPAPVRDDVMASYAAADEDDDDQAFRPPPDPDETSELDVESYLRDVDDWEEDPVPRGVRTTAAPPPAPRSDVSVSDPTADIGLPPAPEPKTEPKTEPEPFTEATNWSSDEGAEDEPPPAEPVRGAWEAPPD